MIVNVKNLEPFVKIAQARNKKIVLTGGCFDILHKAHIEFLLRSKKQGDALILLLESDENIKKLKGKNRPVNDIEKRSSTLESLGFIDVIVLLPATVTDKYYYNLTKLIQPDIIALTKNDPLTEKKGEQAKMVGGKAIEVMNRDENYSSRYLINKK